VRLSGGRRACGRGARRRRAVHLRPPGGAVRPHPGFPDRRRELLPHRL